MFDMATWYGTSRSNYFAVKNLEDFRAECDKLGIPYWDDREGLIAVYSDTGEGWPSSVMDDESGDTLDFDVVEVISKHLCEGEVAILMESGAENLRYVTGRAIAFTRDNRRVIDLSDIYNLAKTMTDRPDDVTLAEY
jgi:hypothetical protein